MSFHHKSIKRFSMEGTIYDEAHVDRLKREYLALLVLQMKHDGFVVRADIDIDFTLSFVGPKEGYRFKISVYGVYVGKKRAQELDRLYGYKPQYANRPNKRNKERSGTT